MIREKMFRNLISQNKGRKPTKFLKYIIARIISNWLILKWRIERSKDFPTYNLKQRLKIRENKIKLIPKYHTNNSTQLVSTHTVQRIILHPNFLNILHTNFSQLVDIHYNNKKIGKISIETLLESNTKLTLTITSMHFL
jgi:hypothetical protein